MTRVAFIDDHESVRLGLEAACARAEARTSSSRAAPSPSTSTGGRSARQPPADVVVLDLTLGDGTTVTENVRRLVLDGSSVIIHSVADRPAAVREALAAGAAGVVSKSSPIGDVIAAIAHRRARRAAQQRRVGERRRGRPRVRRRAAVGARARRAAALRRRSAAQGRRRPPRRRVLHGEGEHHARAGQVRRGRSPRADQGRPAAPRDGGRHPRRAAGGPGRPPRGG